MAVGSVPVGANSIAFYHGVLFVVNTDKGTIVRIHIRPDGNPGKPEVWATPKKCWNRCWRDSHFRQQATDMRSMCTETFMSRGSPARHCEEGVFRRIMTATVPRFLRLST